MVVLSSDGWNGRRSRNPVGTEPRVYLEEGFHSVGSRLLIEGGEVCWGPHWTSLELLAQDLAEPFKHELEKSQELDEAKRGLRNMQEILQLRNDLLATLPKEQRAAWISEKEYRQRQGKPSGTIAMPRSRNLPPTRLSRMSLPEAEAPADGDSEERTPPTARPTKLRPTTVGQAALMRLEAVKPSDQEFQAAVEQVSQLESELAAIHSRQQEIRDKLLKTWRSALTQPGTQLAAAKEQLVEARDQMFRAKLFAEISKEDAAELQAKLSASEAELAACRAQQQHQQQQQAEHEQQMQQLQQRLAAAKAEAAGYKQQLASQQQQAPVPPVQVTLKLQSDAAQLQHMAAQLAAAQAASAVVQQQQQQQAQVSKPQESAESQAAVTSAGLSLAPVVHAGMSREDEEQQQPDTPVVWEQTAEPHFFAAWCRSSWGDSDSSSWGDSDSSSNVHSSNSSPNSSRRSSMEGSALPPNRQQMPLGGTMAAVQLAAGQVAMQLQLQQQAAYLAASSAQVVSSLISSSSSDDSSDSAAAYDTAVKPSAAKCSAAGGDSSSSMQHSQPTVQLSAPPAAASSSDSVGFVPRFAAQLGRWASAWLGAQSVPQCQWLPATAAYQQC